MLQYAKITKILQITSLKMTYFRTVHLILQFGVKGLFGVADSRSCFSVDRRINAEKVVLQS